MPNEPIDEEVIDDGPIMELDQTDLERMIDERAEARAQELLAAQEESRERSDREIHLELARLRRRDHEATVREQIQLHQERGVPVSVLTRAAELMLSDTSHETVLELSRDGEELSLTASDIVLQMLETIPAVSLHASQPTIPANLGLAPESDEDGRSVQEKADDLLKDLKEGEVVRVPTM
jgi:hypothetical protein